MQDENLMKMSQIATPPLMDTHMANILICCLLDHLKKPVTPTQLYEIAVETEIINYLQSHIGIKLSARQSNISFGKNGGRKSKSPICH